ncbi:MAG: (2Fe-2S)-binding protein [Firmicutes bacterium]|nr:(2Fe-2S)-binding protein [Bacillota bacterium]
MDKKSREYEICPCRHVTRGQVEDIIREQEIKDLKTLCEVANVGNKCGGCREELMFVLDEIWTK